MRWLLVLTMLAAAGNAAADLYRWVDPETGSVKFSSYPPPWYSEEGSARGKPKVERIPPGREPVVRVEDKPAGTSAVLDPRIEVLAEQRRTVLRQIPGLAAQRGTERGALELKKLVESLAAVSEQLDRLDPAGGARRRAETQGVLQQMVKGEAK